MLSGYRNWDELSHAEEWLVFPENLGPNLAIDETSLSNGDLYTIVTNRDRPVSYTHLQEGKSLLYTLTSRFQAGNCRFLH